MYEVPEVTVAIGVMLLSLYILYPETPMLSKDAVHDNAICEEESAVADSEAGIVGSSVSGIGAGGGVEEPNS